MYRILSSQGSVTIAEKGVERLRVRGGRWIQGKYQGKCPLDIAGAAARVNPQRFLTACTNPVHAQARLNPSMQKGSGHPSEGAVGN